jgi:hypothetical protein
MKKVSTLKMLALVCAVPFIANGQSAARLQMSTKHQASPIYKVAPGEETPLVRIAPSVRNASKKGNSTSAATIIGTTTYDLQSNGGVARRTLAYSNGAASAAWTGSSSGDLAAPDRGTWYNSTANGTTWGANPTARLESKRVGWGNLNKVTAGEIVCAHVNGVTTNTGPGTTWTTTRDAGEFRGKTWPRVATSGNNVHFIISDSGPLDAASGFVSPVYYGRSLNGGTSFDTVSATFAAAAGYDTTNHAGDISADSYSIDANGNNVAIFITGTTEDIVLLNSTDNGTTWTRKVIREFPIKKYISGPTDANGDGVNDTLLGNTSNGTVIIDGNGVTHVAWADLRVVGDTAGLSVFLTATSDYFNYWNSATQTIIEVPVLADLDNNGSFDAGSNFTAGSTVRYGNSGYSLHPQFTLGANNEIFMTYTAVAENDTNDIGVDFRNIWMRGTNDNGATWGPIVNISNTLNEENAYPNTNREVVGGKIHVSWQKDFDPGVAVQGGHAFAAADIVYEAVDVSTYFVGINDAKKLDAAIVAYPNPTSDIANFNVTVDNAMKAEVKLVNILGQTVKTISADLTAGVNKLSINVESLNAGVYTMVLSSNGKTATEKIMVK